MADIVLTTFNARFAHPAVGLRALLANLGSLRPRATLLEFIIAQRAVDALEAVLAEDPRIVGISVSIWNVAQTAELISLLKSLRPEIVVVLGGPEVSWEIDEQTVTAQADFVIAGEGDLAFAELCGQILSGNPPETKVLRPIPPDLTDVALYYDEYADEDIAHRVIYVEASRGCPYRCEFCLSARETGVRQVDPDRLMAALERLYARGVRHFKFLDRTFNLALNTPLRLLSFFAERADEGIFVHLEMVPHRLPDELVTAMAAFPDGAIQLEVGVQTLNDEVAKRIARVQDTDTTLGNLRRLRDETGAHIHADLIVGLPGEDVASFAAGFDRLLAAGPHEIQVGILKRLRGAPIARHSEAWGMVYAPRAPYEVLETSTMDFATLRRLTRFSKTWDMVANSGHFPRSAPMLWEGQSPFAGFLAFADWLYREVGRTHGIALRRLVGLMFRYLVEDVGRDANEVSTILLLDYHRDGRTDLPPGFAGHGPPRSPRRRSPKSGHGRRQQRHKE